MATELLQSAEFVAIPVSVLCEFVWVLRQGYRKSNAQIASAIRKLTNSSNVITNDLAVNAGLQILDACGDFSDGAIAFEGAQLGAHEFVSFDKQAVKLLKAQGKRARLIA